MAHFVASMISGLVTTIASMPVDITKTRYHLNTLPYSITLFLYRIQNMKIIDGKPEYTGAIVSVN